MSINRLLRHIFHAIKYYDIFNKNAVELYIPASNISKETVKNYSTTHVIGYSIESYKAIDVICYSVKK